MKEIGGYIELDKYSLPMLHEGAVALNCGRNCLAYIIRSRKIKAIALPYLLCDSVIDLCEKDNVRVKFYHIDENFLPADVELCVDEWLYLVNFYGQLDNGQIAEIKDIYERVIVDNAQAYFAKPLENTDTIYTCRKFFGVADGAFLYTDNKLECEFPMDKSYERMDFLLGRFEGTASDFYSEYTENNRLFKNEPIKEMSKLTDNLLRGIDYENVKNKRTENYNYLFDALAGINKLKLKRAEGAFAYPLWLQNGAEVRKALQKDKIYIPTLWPNVFKEQWEGFMEYEFAKNILPIPVDQRYNTDDMEYILQLLQEGKFI